MPPSAGPPIWETFCPRLFSVIAFISRCEGTTAGMSACRTGCPTAMPTPANRAITMAIPTDITSTQIRMAVSKEEASTRNWLTKSSTRRSQRSGEHPYREREKEHRHAQREAHRPQEKVPGQQCFNDQPGEGEAQDALHERVAEVVQPEQPEVAYAEGRERLQAKPTPSRPYGTGPRAPLVDPSRQSPTSASAALQC